MIGIDGFPISVFVGLVANWLVFGLGLYWGCFQLLPKGAVHVEEFIALLISLYNSLLLFRNFKWLG